VVVDQAFGWCNARIIDSAWTLALSIVAGLVGRALRVRSAADSSASHLGVSLESGRTLTDGFVTDSVANGSVSAARGFADGHAVLVQTGVLSGALVVAQAADSRALDLGVALETDLASANRSVFSDAALGVGAAVAWVSAHAVDARLFRRALAVSDASHLGERRDGLADAISAADVSLGTLADHCAHRQRIGHHGAPGRSTARLVNGARISTALVHAGEC
jgi:hypothetical protein